MVRLFFAAIGTIVLSLYLLLFFSPTNPLVGLEGAGPNPVFAVLFLGSAFAGLVIAVFEVLWRKRGRLVLVSWLSLYAGLMTLLSAAGFAGLGWVVGATLMTFSMLVVPLSLREACVGLRLRTGPKKPEQTGVSEVFA